jgi:type IV fimbrial biogenesis protein FimT
MLGDPQGRDVLTMRVSQAAFTLVEVLIAIAVVALLLMLGAPSAATWMQNLQLRNGADSVVSGLKQARYEAIKRNTLVAFELTDPDSTAWHICLYDIASAACTGADLMTGAAEGSQNARVGVELNFTDYATPIAAGDTVPALVAFDSLGRVAPASPANIARVDVRNPSMTSGERRLSIRVDVNGQVRLCDPSLSIAANPQGCA